MAAIPEPVITNESSQATRESQPRAGSFSLRLDDVGVHHSGSWRMVLDLVFALTSAVVVAFSIRHVGMHGDSGLASGSAATLRQALGPVVLLCVATIWLCSLRGIYSGTWISHRRSSLQVAYTVAVVTVLVSAVLWLCGVQSAYKIEIACSGILNLVFLGGWRLINDRLLESKFAKGRGIRNVLIVGADNTGEELVSFLESAPQLGYRVKGFLDDHLTGEQVLGTTSELWRIAGAQFVDEVFVTASQSRQVIERITKQAKQEHFDVHLIPEFHSEIRSLNYLGKFPLIALYREPITPFALCLKRMVDVLLSFTGLVLLSPVLVLVAALIKLDSPGTILYVSARVGKKGRTFTFYKFRTMVSGAEALKEQLKDMNERNGVLFKVKNDPRVTRVGRFLRKYSVDELPQLWNVLEGDMSLVGPRPPSLDEFEHYSTDHLRRLSVKPGITGNWQVKGRQDPSFDTALFLDLEYINNWSLSFDFRLLMRTVGTVLKGTGW